MRSRQRFEKKLSIFELIFIVLLFALYLLPSVSIGTTLLLLLLSAYCVYLSVVDPELFGFISKIALLIFAIAFLYAMLTDASSIAQSVSNRETKRFISKVYQYLTLYFPMVLLFRVERRASGRQKAFFVLMGVGMMIYVIQTTWSFLTENPYATRHWESFGETTAQGVADYYFIYAVPIIIAILTVMLSKPGILSKIVLIIAIILGVVFLVNAQYTLSILIAIIGIFIQIFRNLRSSTSRVVFVGFATLFLLMLPEMLEFAIEIVPSKSVSTRLSEIHSFLTGEGTSTRDNNLNGRFTLYWKTIKAFFASPIWGNRYLPFDGHATFLTVLADIGIIGGIPFYMLLYMAVRNIRRLLGENKKRFTAVVIMFVMMGLTNPIHASMPLGFAMWFLAPLMILTVFKEKEDETAMEN